MKRRDFLELLGVTWATGVGFAGGFMAGRRPKVVEAVAVDPPWSAARESIPVVREMLADIKIDIAAQVRADFAQAMAQMIDAKLIRGGSVKDVRIEEHQIAQVDLEVELVPPITMIDAPVRIVFE